MAQLTPSPGTTPQSTPINTVFPTALQVRWVLGGITRAGWNITFTAPNTGPSGSFPGGLLSVSVETDTNGIATAPPFTANGIAGGPYRVIVSVEVDGDTVSSEFLLTNLAPPSTQSYLVRYVSNLNLGDGVINITNTGERGAGLAAGTTAATAGAICANVYAFSPDEQMVACCSCPVTPNGLVSLSAREDLLSNTLTPAVPTSIVVKLLASVPQGGSCANSAAGVTAAILAPGIQAWGTTAKANTAGTGVALVETRFAPATLSPSELNRLQQLCTFIGANGSGFGICRSCRLGGLGAGRQ